MGVLLLSCTSLLWLGDISMMSSALLSIKGTLDVAGLLSVAGLLWIAGSLSVAGQAMTQSLAISRSLTILLSLANSVGVVLIGLGGVNLDCLTAFSKFNPNFLVLPDPISYYLRLTGSFLKSLLQLVQFLAQLGERLFYWIGFLTCLLGGAEIGFHCSVFHVPAAVLGSVHSMRPPMFLA